MSEEQKPENQPAEVKEMALPLQKEAKSPFHVKLPAYDGPLDLLLELIKKNEMDIYDIRIAEITQQYLDELKRMRELDLEIAGEFIVMAATLIYIKSKMLLPVEEEIEDEEGQDPRAELVQKLLEYQAYKEAAKELGVREQEKSQTFTRKISDYYLSQMDAGDVEIDSFSADLYDLLSAFQKVMSRGSRTAMHEVYEEMISIEEKIYEIQSLILEKEKVKFFSLFSEKWNRNELIATFLAILELVKSKFVRVTQDKQYGEILIEKGDPEPQEQIGPQI